MFILFNQCGFHTSCHYQSRKQRNGGTFVLPVASGIFVHHVREGGLEQNHSHHDWLDTEWECPHSLASSFSPLIPWLPLHPVYRTVPHMYRLAFRVGNALLLYPELCFTNAMCRTGEIVHRVVLCRSRTRTWVWILGTTGHGSVHLLITTLGCGDRRILGA